MSVIARAALILRTLSDSRRGLTLAELARRTDMARSSVHRIIRELEDEHLVIMVSRGGGYRLGPGVLKLTASSHAQLVAAIRPRLLALAAEVQDNVDLAVLSGREVVVVDQVSSLHRLQAVTHIGGVFPVHASCLGKVLLAGLPDEQARELLSGELRAYTPHTTTSAEEIISQLAVIRGSWIAFDREEHDIGISAVATMVRSPIGIAQAISIVAPTPRFQSLSPSYVAALMDLRRSFDRDSQLGGQARTSWRPSRA